MDKISKKIDSAIARLLRVDEKKEVFVITEDEEGKIIDSRMMSRNFAIFILRHGERGKEPEEKPDEFESYWWHPSR